MTTIKMKNRMIIWTASGIAGVLILIADMVFQDRLTDAATGILCGLGCSLIAMAGANLIIIVWEKRHPKLMKQNEIESKDERNVMIREKAQSLSGQILQWTVLAAAWLNLVAGGPLWITITALVMFFGKTVLDVVLAGYYQQQM